MQRFGLRDDQWERIKDFLPGRQGHVGGTAADNRLFVDAVLYRYRTGIAIATRYDKLARNFLAGVQLAAITILLN